MTAALLATVTTPQKVTRRQNQQPAFKVVVLAFNQRSHYVRAVIAHLLKDKRGARASNAARSPKAALKVFMVEHIVQITKEAQRPRFATEWQCIAGAQIGFHYSAKTVTTARKCHRVENGSDVVARACEIKIHEKATTETLRHYQ